MGSESFESGAFAQDPIDSDPIDARPLAPELHHLLADLADTGRQEESMHSIGAFAVIFDDDQHVLLCHRTDRDMWNLPGGRVESGESPWQGVVREVLEETGLDVEVVRLHGVYSLPWRDDLVLNFICRRTGGELRTNPEADQLGWFAVDALPANTFANHVERIVDAVSRTADLPLRIQTS